MKREVTYSGGQGPRQLQRSERARSRRPLRFEVRASVIALGLSVVLSAGAARAEDVGGSCREGKKVGATRYYRQLTLDLLGRIPTVEEYRRIAAAGAVSEDEIRNLMLTEDFYARMRGYHRKLLRANVAAAVNNSRQGEMMRASTGVLPLFWPFNPSTNIRGLGVPCDANIRQDECNSGPREDPHAEPAVKTCYDAMGVPLPVSFDYSTSFYQCTELGRAKDCPDAVTRGLLPAKLLYYCDMRRTGAALKPHLCLPDPARPQTAALTQEVMDGDKVVAFRHPAPPVPAPSGMLVRLDRCGLTLALTNGRRGQYTPQTGCVQREGYTERQAPYWDTTGVSRVAICAVEAQERNFDPYTMLACDPGRFQSVRSCGCGPGYKRCEPLAPNGTPASVVHSRRIRDVSEEPLRIFDSVIRREEDYFTALTTRRSFVNSTLSQMYREGHGSGVFELSAPAERAAIPDIPYSADPANWVEYTRGAQHSGVLTTPAWLYRFPTARSRLAQYYGAFMCRHFAPPANAVLPPQDDGCHRENNLAKRCACNACHSTLEPQGAHWGRFAERSGLYLSPALFPKLNVKCRECAMAGNTFCDGECSEYFMRATDDDEAQSLGLLNTYLFRTPDEQRNIEAGPRALVEQTVASGDLERCAVRNMWAEFLGRPMTDTEQSMYLDELTEKFVRSGHNVKALIRAVLASPGYRRVD